jgi:S1-C subfamily serine protease
VPVDLKPFGILVRGKIEGSQILMHQLGVSGAVEVKKTDLALIKIKMDRSLFPDGFPTVDIADYSDLHEMMDVATCGYPFGDYLWRQTGSISSSFTKGALSTICPLPGIALEHLDSFQLDLTSFEGNSGGPVFCANTGKVFGVLRSGIREPKKDQDIVGLSIAEPVYPAFQDQLIEKLLAGECGEAFLFGSGRGKFLFKLCDDRLAAHVRLRKWLRVPSPSLVTDHDFAFCRAPFPSLGVRHRRSLQPRQVPSGNARAIRSSRPLEEQFPAG